jgi:2-polyprenyl-3-methyl-5-hydroxy-6-metoxy-1,4-benzoquinol methylase
MVCPPSPSPSPTRGEGIIGLFPKQVEIMDTENTNTLTLFILEEADAYHRWIFKKIRPFLGKDILEVGCGIGSLTELLLTQGRVIAADVNGGYLQTVENKFRRHPNLKGVLLWDIRQAPPKNLGAPVDTIVCSNVLEHIEDDDDVLKSLYHLLPAGGRLIILVPALKALYNVFDKGLGHIRRYSRSELAQKLTRNGFRICSLKYFNLFGILGWFVNGTLLRRRLLPARQIRIFNKMIPLFIRMEKIIPTLVGQSLIVVGKKG